MNILKLILGFFTGGGVNSLATQAREAYEARLNAQNNTERLEADKLIEQIQSAREIALAEASRPLSATSLGRYLIILPYGLWWASIFAVSMINPWFGLNIVVHAIPQEINEMAKILIPAITIGSIFDRR